MSTRGLWGLRKNNTDKLEYYHFDSYPEDGLGFYLLDCLKRIDKEDLSTLFDSIELVKQFKEEEGFVEPTQEQIDFYKSIEAFEPSVSSRSELDWYCLLRRLQGQLGYRTHLALRLNSPEYTAGIKKQHMIDSCEFIKDSLFCEYAYIINLDTNKLECYKGFQVIMDTSNRYGFWKLNGYYPCKMVGEMDLDEIREKPIEDSREKMLQIYEDAKVAEKEAARAILAKGEL